MDWSIERLERRHLAVSAEIVRRAFAGPAREFGLTRENCPSNGAFLRDEALCADLERGCSLFGLFVSREQAGFAALDSRDGRVWYLEKLAVLPNFRGCGLGAALVEHAALHARARGGVTLSVGLIRDNRRLLAWYQRRGFTVTGSRTFAHLPFVVCFMQRSLER